MDYAAICIIKRDGKQENFSMQKISNAIGKAFSLPDWRMNLI